MTKMMALSDSWRSGPRPRRGLRVKPGAGNAEPKRRGASPGSGAPQIPRPEGAESGCLCSSIPQILFIVLDTVLFQQSEKLFLE